MDKVLKRRLIGASILIALAVIFVPMLLVDPDSVEDGSGSGVDVPAMPDSAREVRRIPLDPEAARVAQPERRSSRSGAGSEASSETDRDRATDEPERVRPDDEIVLRPDLAERQRGREQEGSDTADAPARAESGQDQPSTQDPAEDAAPPPESAPGSESEPEREQQSGPDAAAREISEASPGEWVVQVASFGSRESAEQVRQRLEALGHTVSRDEIVRGQSLLYRLRTGPYGTESAARQALEQIAATVAGVEPIVREVDERLRQGAEAAFAVQVGSFVSEDNADSETGRLEELGFESFRFSEEVGERIIWRVMVGPVAERSAADELKARLVERAGVEGLVVSYP